MEFMNPEFGIENVRPYSPSQQDLLKIFEDGVLKSNPDKPEEIEDILKRFGQSDAKKRPSRSEILKYKSWLEQKYRSPYTGEVIPLGKLFTPAYEIEHVIPQSLYFDDSFSNKVICESEVNKLKGNMLGHEFISKNAGRIVELSFGKPVRILSLPEYEAFVKNTYANNRPKMKKLLMDEIPDDFSQRQMNDTRYISRKVLSLLSNIVRTEDEQMEVSKNVIPCNGSITDRLKKDWGVNDVWNRIVLPRFERLNELTGKNAFTTRNANGKIVPCMPLELQKGFTKKRIDHRHHAMDAIVIACAGRSIINYLNNESANGGATRKDLQRLICEKSRQDDKGNYQWIVKKPWDTFTEDVYSCLKNIVVSFKSNCRVLTKTTNHFQHYQEGKKVSGMQSALAVRKSMHKDTIFGKVRLRYEKDMRLEKALEAPQWIVDKELKKEVLQLLGLGYDAKRIKKYYVEHYDEDISKVQVYCFTDNTYATRKSVDKSFTAKIIEKVTDSGIRKILRRHLENKGNDPELAFSPEGIDEMNRNIKELNGGKPHKPIYKVRWSEESNKFAIGKKGCKSRQFVEADKGTNLYFAIYETEQMDKKTGEIVRKRSYDTIPLNLVISRLKGKLPPAPEDENGNPPKYVLSPNDLVYVPSAEEGRTGIIKKPLDLSRVYKMVSSNKGACFFIQAQVASSIIDKVEFSSSNKMERALSGEMIKDVCVPLKIDRLGHIISIGNVPYQAD